MTKITAALIFEDTNQVQEKFTQIKAEHLDNDECEPRGLTNEGELVLAEILARNTK